MPWELGYFDGLKSRVAILPVLGSDYDTNKYVGQEYLGLYPYAARDPNNAGIETLWIHYSSDIYVSYDGWLAGIEPTKR